MPNSFKPIQSPKVLLHNRQLGEYITVVRSYLDEQNLTALADRLDTIEANYKRMQAFMLKGVEDEQREYIYNQLLCKVYELSVEAKIAAEYKKNIFYSVAQSHTVGLDLSLSNIKETCQRYVQDISISQLEIKGGGEKDDTHLYRQHHQFLNALFESIVVSGPWNDEQQYFYTELLSSALVATSDVLVLVSAITLACKNFFDIHKMRVLHQVYHATAEKQVKQRAFCGMVFAMSPFLFLYDDAEKIKETLAHEKNSLNRLLQLLVHANNTDRDAAKIHQEILPDLIEGQKKFMDSSSDLLRGSSLEEILNPEEDEQLVQKMEESMGKMNKMIQEGVDLYFGGFAQSKRHPFFMSYQNTCNWFLPFDMSHPDLQQMAQTENGKKVLKMLSKLNVFCDSDKYSLALRMDLFLNQIPPQMLDMLASDQMYGPSIQLEPEVERNINTGYVQDMYRFYRLNQFQPAFSNPFSIEKESSAMLYTLLYIYNDDENLYEVLTFLYKNKLYEYLKLYFDEVPTSQMFKTNLLHANYLLVMNEVDEALSIYETLYESNPLNRQLCLALAVCYAHKHQYDKASMLYRELYSREPGSERIAYNLAFVQFRAGIYDEASSILYRINYEHPENASAIQLLVRVLLAQNMQGKAKNLALKLLDLPDQAAEGHLLLGYVYAVNSNFSVAMEHFQKCEGFLDEALRNDEFFLKGCFKVPVNYQILCDMISSGTSAVKE